MTDWSKLKVTDLKEELKTRGIALAGLKLKHQLIDKLEQLDGATDDIGHADERMPKHSEHDEMQGLDIPDPQPEEVDDQKSARGTEVEIEDARLEEVDNVPATSKDQDGEIGTASTSEKPSAPAEQPLLENETSTEDISPHVREGSKNSSQDAAKSQLAIECMQETISNDKTGADMSISDHLKTDSQEPVEESHQPILAVAASGSGTPSLQVAAAELLPDSRKRKRRSVTPPSAADIAQKKAKASNGSPITTKRQSSTPDEMQEATNATEVVQSASRQEEERPMNTIATMPGPDVTNIALVEIKPPVSKQEASPAPVVEPEKPERFVSPARHPATSSLYMRNFKRPLHIPSLRNHIISLATPSLPADDPIKTFYLDSIRTHAFVSFTSIAAASRVRSAMHDVRFPDEALREPLFVDFVPDDQVQRWIDEETDASGGGRRPSGKFEVVYHEGPDGVEAALQIIGAVKDQGFGRRDSTAQPQPPKRSASGLAGLPGVHPDRAILVPQDDLSLRRKDAPPPPKPDTNNGTGFKALDELFSFTTAKPKLYYKPVPSSIAEDRMDKFRDLRVGHADMGKSGDEGMKRYTFETDRGRQVWIDKGPEFGFGKRGVDRLSGRGGRGGGSFRGGGAGRFERGDSWRGR